MEYFWLAKQSQEAFAVAERHHLLEQYLRLAGADASPEDLARATGVLEARGDHERAADLHRTMGNLAAAAAMFLKVRPSQRFMCKCVHLSSFSLAICDGGLRQFHSLSDTPWVFLSTSKVDGNQVQGRWAYPWIQVQVVHGCRMTSPSLQCSCQSC